MSHGHHHHHHAADDNREKILKISLILTAAFMLVEFIAGFLAHSLALMADAVHMLTDAGALGLALFAVRWSRKNADEHRSFGYGRMQVLAAFVNGLAVAGLAALLSGQAIRRFWHPQEVESGLMLWVAVIGFLVNLAIFAVMHRSDGKNINIRAAALHVLFDLLSSAAVIIAALLIKFTGWMDFDAIATFVVSLLVAKGAKEIIAETGHILLEGKPRNLDLSAIAATIRSALPEVKDVHHMHAWSLSGEDVLLTLHLTINPGINPDEVLRKVKALLEEKFHIHHTTLQIECDGCADPHH